MLQYVTGCKGVTRTVQVRVLFKDEMAEKFKTIKENLGVNNNTEVVRICINTCYKELLEKPSEKRGA